MRDFFKGWRRKVGCVALVMALASVGAWMRTTWLGDRVTIHFPTSTHELTFSHGAFSWMRFPGQFPPAGFAVSWHTWPVGTTLGYSLGNDEDEYQRALAAAWEIPYWSVALPLILLSAYLLLWKPRKQTGPDHA